MQWMQNATSFALAVSNRSGLEYQDQTENQYQ